MAEDVQHRRELIWSLLSEVHLSADSLFGNSKSIRVQGTGQSVSPEPMDEIDRKTIEKEDGLGSVRLHVTPSLTAMQLRVVGGCHSTPLNKLTPVHPNNSYPSPNIQLGRKRSPSVTEKSTQNEEQPAHEYSTRKGRRHSLSSAHPSHQKRHILIQERRDTGSYSIVFSA